jgi:hypothetical protein
VHVAPEEKVRQVLAVLFLILALLVANLGGPALDLALGFPKLVLRFAVRARR